MIRLRVMIRESFCRLLATWLIMRCYDRRELYRRRSRHLPCKFSFNVRIRLIGRRLCEVCACRYLGLLCDADDQASCGDPQNVMYAVIHVADSVMLIL